MNYRIKMWNENHKFYKVQIEPKLLKGGWKNGKYKNQDNAPIGKVVGWVWGEGNGNILEFNLMVIP